MNKNSDRLIWRIVLPIRCHGSIIFDIRVLDKTKWFRGTSPPKGDSFWLTVWEQTPIAVFGDKTYSRWFSMNLESCFAISVYHSTCLPRKLSVKFYCFAGCRIILRVHLSKRGSTDVWLCKRKRYKVREWKVAKVTNFYLNTVITCNNFNMVACDDHGRVRKLQWIQFYLRQKLFWWYSPINNRSVSF